MMLRCDGRIVLLPISNLQNIRTYVVGKDQPQEYGFPFKMLKFVPLDKHAKYVQFVGKQLITHILDCVSVIIQGRWDKFVN